MCIEADTCNGYVQKDNTFTCEYESIIGFGDAETVTGDERFEGLDLIMEHCGFNAREYNMKVAEITGVFKVTVHEFTGKRRVIKNNFCDCVRGYMENKKIRKFLLIETAITIIAVISCIFIYAGKIILFSIIY